MPTYLSHAYILYVPHLGDRTGSQWASHRFLRDHARLEVRETGEAADYVMEVQRGSSGPALRESTGGGSVCYMGCWFIVLQAFMQMAFQRFPVNYRP